MRRRSFMLGVGTMVSSGSALLPSDARGQDATARGDAAERQPGTLVELLTPSPREVKLGGDYTSIGEGWSIAVTEPSDPRLAGLAQRLASHIATFGGPRLPIRPFAPGAPPAQTILLVELGGVAPRIDLVGRDLAERLASRASRWPVRPGAPPANRHEAYALSVGEDHIRLVGHAADGVLVGAQTLMQLVTLGSFRGRGQVPRAMVFDWPENALRGYLADVRKPPYGFADSAMDGWKRHIDRIAAVKGSYIVFEQSRAFRYQFPGVPVGLPTGFTMESARALSEHAYAQGVVIIPMIELSQGDSLVGYMARSARQHPWMADHNNEGFCPFNERSYPVVARILGELAAAFPHSPYLHVGEDETPAIPGSAKCPVCRNAAADYARQTGTAPDLICYPMAHFHARVSELARAPGRQIMVWGTFAFRTPGGGVHPTARAVMPRDVIVWDWENVGFGRAGFQTWLPYTPSWEWKGPGIPEFISHMIAAEAHNHWVGRTSDAAPAPEERRRFARAWAVTTFGIDDPALGEVIADAFGFNLYGHHERWHRLRWGNYLLRKPADFTSPAERHPRARLDADLKSWEAIVTRLGKATPALNRSLLAWYADGARLSLFALQYVRDLQTAHEAWQQAAQPSLDAESRRGRVAEVRSALQAALDRFDGPITAIFERSRTELGGPLFPKGEYGSFDFSGRLNGVRPAVQAVLQRAQQLDAGRPASPPERNGLLPTVTSEG